MGLFKKFKLIILRKYNFFLLIYLIPALLLRDKYKHFIKESDSMSFYLLGWGNKESSEKIKDLSLFINCDFFFIEDGFIRSLGRNDKELSIVVDTKGVYYNASKPSDCEEAIKSKLLLSQISRSKKLINKFRLNNISKYNLMPVFEDYLPPYVLVVDQVESDLSIKLGLANKKSFEKMLDAALKENPDKCIVVKIHPDVYINDKNSNFCLKELKCKSRIILVDSPVSPSSLIANAESVYVVTSQIGFEAVIYNKKVRVFGMPFYAGWGLTHDEISQPERRCSATIEQLVYGVLISYSSYISPVSGRPCEVEDVIDYIATQKEKYAKI